MALADDLRIGMRRLAAGVCVVSTRVPEGRFAMTASSVTSLSDSPASLLVCINTDAAIQAHMQKGVPFVVSVLSTEQQDISNLCAQKEAGEERFAIEGWAEHGNKKLPYIKDAQAIFICEVDNEKTIYGTHQVVIGKLTKAILPEVPVKPLVYADGAYQQLSSID